MTSPPASGGSPYGPATRAIRRFLMHLAGLGAADRAAVVASYAHTVRDPAYERVDASLADLVERSGRDEARIALSGPLLQLVRRPAADHTEPARDADAGTAVGTADDEFEPIAEPALAAVLALLVRDLLSPAAFTLLYGPFEPVIPHERL